MLVVGRVEFKARLCGCCARIAWTPRLAHGLTFAFLPPLQRGKDANDVLAALFSWARGRPVTPAEVERCFPLVPHGKVLMPYVLWDRITELGKPAAQP